MLRTRFSEVDRAVIDDETDGFVKLVTVNGKLLGAHIVGAHAGELIHTAVLAMHGRLGLRDLASMVWVYPTHSEALRMAAQSRYEGLAGSGRGRRVLALLRGWKRRR